MRIDLDYGLNGSGNLSNQEISRNFVAYAVNKKYEGPGGAGQLNGTHRRIYGRIQRKLEKAIQEKASEIELEAAEKDFLRGVFTDEKLTFPANDAQYVVVLEDEMEKLKS